MSAFCTRRRRGGARRRCRSGADGPGATTRAGSCDGQTRGRPGAQGAAGGGGAGGGRGGGGGGGGGAAGGGGGGAGGAGGEGGGGWCARGGVGVGARGGRAGVCGCGAVPGDSRDGRGREPGGRGVGGGEGDGREQAAHGEADDGAGPVGGGPRCAEAGPAGRGLARPGRRRGGWGARRAGQPGGRVHPWPPCLEPASPWPGPRGARRRAGQPVTRLAAPHHVQSRDPAIDAAPEQRPTRSARRRGMMTWRRPDVEPSLRIAGPARGPGSANVTAAPRRACTGFTDSAGPGPGGGPGGGEGEAFSRRSCAHGRSACRAAYATTMCAPRRAGSCRWSAPRTGSR